MKNYVFYGLVAIVVVVGILTYSNHKRWTQTEIKLNEAVANQVTLTNNQQGLVDILKLHVVQHSAEKNKG